MIMLSSDGARGKIEEVRLRCPSCFRDTKHCAGMIDMD
jgi:hypothetical protein